MALDECPRVPLGSHRFSSMRTPGGGESVSSHTHTHTHTPGLILASPLLEALSRPSLNPASPKEPRSEGMFVRWMREQKQETLWPVLVSLCAQKVRRAGPGRAPVKSVLAGRLVPLISSVYSLHFSKNL